MGKYNAPKKRLHREFIYLDDESIINSLSAFEAGKVDEIIEKTTEATEKGFGGELGAGPATLKGARLKQAELKEELVRKRTRFSTFEAWHQTMTVEDAFGRFKDWDMEVRNALRSGDTLEFDAQIELTPLHMMIATFAAYARSAETAESPFELNKQQLAETKKTARMMQSWTQGPHGHQSLMVNLRPAAGIDGPRLMTRLDEPNVIGGFDRVQGEVRVIAQVDHVLRPDERESVIRVLKGVPPTPLEMTTIRDALKDNMLQAASGFGLTLSEADVEVSHPTVVVRTLAIWK
jgi:hypothetical protein